jgi:hypothetical protein
MGAGKKGVQGNSPSNIYACKANITKVNRKSRGFFSTQAVYSFISLSAPLLMQIRNKGQNKAQGKD